MRAFDSLFQQTRPVIGMIHLQALPGTPAHARNLRAIEAQAVREGKLLRDAGVHGLMLENMHDTPYLRSRVGPEIVASMAIIARVVKSATELPCGVQVLAGANLDAMAVAHAAGLEFVRVEGFAFAHVADEGWIDSSAAELLRISTLADDDAWRNRFREAVGGRDTAWLTSVKAQGEIRRQPPAYAALVAAL